MGKSVEPQIIGEHIRRLRLERHVSVRAFAAQTGFSPSFISQLENGQVSPSLGSLQKIAETLGRDARRVLRRRRERGRGGPDRPPLRPAPAGQHLDRRSPRGARLDDPQPQARAGAGDLRARRQERQAPALPLARGVRLRDQGPRDAHARGRGKRAGTGRRRGAAGTRAASLGEPGRRRPSRCCSSRRASRATDAAALFSLPKRLSNQRVDGSVRLRLRFPVWDLGGLDARACVWPAGSSWLSAFGARGVWGWQQPNDAPRSPHHRCLPPRPRPSRRPSRPPLSSIPPCSLPASNPGASASCTKPSQRLGAVVNAAIDRTIATAARPVRPPRPERRPEDPQLQQAYMTAVVAALGEAGVVRQGRCRRRDRGQDRELVQRAVDHRVSSRLEPAVRKLGPAQVRRRLQPLDLARTTHEDPSRRSE